MTEFERLAQQIRSQHAEFMLSGASKVALRQKMSVEEVIEQMERVRCSK